ncbi:glycosyltransferase family 4 protein [Methanolobus sp. ZRKC2]|uniref:glycosyltransferase family 4 protein n=1 Tax=Methanolobus sp. ZRKC2 TaxID=3125783 RepID=UPI0032539E41
MKILACEENILNPVGGGELSFETLLRVLNGKNEVFAIGKRSSRSHESLFEAKSIPVFETNTHMFNKLLVFKQIERAVEKNILKQEPDIVITQQDYSAPAIKAANRHRIPSVVFMRNYEHFCLCADPQRNCSRKCSECYGYSMINPYRYFVNTVFRYEKKWIPKASLVISNSHYMSKIVRDWFNIDSFVIYPFVNEPKLEYYEPEYITMVNASKHKGIDTFLNIAKRMPDKKFLVVGHNPEFIDFSQYENVRYIPWIDNSKVIYSNTKILLVPSIWPEPFGRVCVEAGYCGIPSIASKIGGLPEAVGKGGIVINQHLNVNDWINAINLLYDESIYKEYSEKARIHSMKFNLDTIITQFKDLVKNQVDITV